MVDEMEQDVRVEPPYLLGERPMLEAWLDWHRTTLRLKVEGLTDEQRKARPVPSSTMSLHGLVRHLAEVEWWWFERVLDGDASVEGIFALDDDNPDADWFPLDDAVWEDDLAVWEDRCDRSRAIAARHELDDTGEHPRRGPCSLRWILVHLVEEYARHNGHADLLRELIDGEVGW